MTTSACFANSTRSGWPENRYGRRSRQGGYRLEFPQPARTTRMTTPPTRSAAAGASPGGRATPLTRQKVGQPAQEAVPSLRTELIRSPNRHCGACRLEILRPGSMQ